MPTTQVSDRTKQMIDRFIAEGRTADEAMALDAEETEPHHEDTAYVIEHAKRGIADKEAGRFSTISSKADEDAFWDRVRTNSARMVKAVQSAKQDDDRTTREAAAAGE